MNKYIFPFVALLAIAAACTKEETKVDVSNLEGIEYNHNAPVFKASVGEGSKAVLDPADGNKVKWDGTEHLSVWNGTQTADYITVDTGASANFTTTDDFASAASYVALYPYDGSAEFSAGSVTTTLPAAQTATAAGFDPAAHIAVASSSSTSLSFHNAVAYVKFTVPAGMDDLTSVSFKGNSSEKVAGDCSVNTSTYALTATGSETATLSGTFTEGTTYYLAVAPQAYASGYTVTITRTSGTYEMVSKATNITFERSKARDIGELWDGSYEVTGSAIATPVTATKTVGPRINSNAALKEYTYSYSGALSAGTVAIKRSYASTNVASATVPADGWYHLFYNETTDTFKVYDQDLSVNFGSTIDGMNSIAGYIEDSNVTLYDYNNDEASSVVVTVGSGFTGTYSNGSYINNTSWEFYLDDFFFRSQALYSNIIISKTKNTGDSDPATVVISGLNPARKYDLRISGGRGGGSLAARATKVEVGGLTQTYRQGLDGTGSKPATSIEFRVNNVASFENLVPNASGEIIVTIVGIDTTSACEAHLGCMFISRVAE